MSDWQRLDPRMLVVEPVSELRRFLPVLLGALLAGGFARGGGLGWELLAVPIDYVRPAFGFGGGFGGPIWLCICADSVRRFLPDRETIKAFLVEKDRPGLSLERLEHKLGIKASDTAALLLEDCRIPKDNLLGSPDINVEKGFAGVMQTFDNTRPLVAGMAIGVARAALEELRSILDEAGINYLTVTGRAKSVASYAAKVARTVDGRPVYPDPQRDITDQVGLRVITYVHSDVQAVVDLLDDQVAVHDDRDLGEETASEGRFGYASRHLLVGLHPEQEGRPEHRALRGRQAQVQIRTVLQHAWAEFEHDIRYKGSIPEEHVSEFDRRFTLAAGLLELADREFTAIRDRLRGFERIGARRWDVVLDRGQRIMLPEQGAERMLEQVIAMAVPGATGIMLLTGAGGLIVASGRFRGSFQIRARRTRGAQAGPGNGRGSGPGPWQWAQGTYPQGRRACLGETAPRGCAGCLRWWPGRGVARD